MNLFNHKKFHAIAPIVALTVGGLAGTLSAGNDKMTLSAGKLAKDAKSYYGQTVTVRAEVENVYDSRSFTLDEDSLLAGPDVLVLVPAGMTSTLAHDQVVTVTGRVRPYVVAELERDFDWFKNGKLVTTRTDVDFKTRPVLVATSLMLADGRELLSGGPVAAHHAQAAPMGSDKDMDHKGHDMKAHKAHKDMKAHDALSAGKLASDAKKYYGQVVTVRAEVEDVLDRNSFTLDEDAILAGADVLVLVPAGFDTASLRKDQVVLVSGKVRPYVVAELERDFDWFKNGKIVTTGKKVDYETRPVLVADRIRTMDNRDLLTSR
jgi:hypothetical protein